MKHHKDNSEKANYYNECIIQLLVIISGATWRHS